MRAAVVALLATSLLSVGAPRAAAVDPQQVTFTLEGCRITTGTTLPINGEFVCPDNMYVTGVLGQNWSELDLVPFRLTANNRGPAQTYTVAVAGDYEDGGVLGFDAVTVPVLNQGLSDSTCQAPQAGPQTIRRPGVGGADASVYRNLTITQAAGEFCVYDYTLRLALGSSDFPGAALSGRFGSENFAGSTQNVGIQTQALAPQQLSKTIEAARGDGFLWTVNKSSVPSQLSVDTCLAGPTATFLSTITWTRTPVTGDVTWTSTVLATNPSNRALVITVTDVVSADGAQVDTTTGAPRALPAGAVDYPVLVHAGTAPAGTTTVSDEATATYSDTATGQPIPQRTTASASTAVVDSPPGNTTAEVSDVTTSSGAPISVDEVRSETNPGTVDVPLGEPVVGPITWESGTVSESGQATLTFTAYLEDEFSGEVDVTDTATLIDSVGGEATADATVSVNGNPAAPTITFVKTVDVPPTEDADFRFGLWFAGQDPAVDPPIVSGPVTIAAGETQSQSIAIDVPPSPSGYLYVEEPAPGYVGLGNGVVAPLGFCDTVEGVVANARLLGTLTVVKEVQGDPSGAPATATVVVDCEPGDTYDQILTVTPGTPVETDPIPSGTACTITEPTPPPGYELVTITPSEVVVGAGDTVGVTVTNTRQVGELVVTKVIVGEVAGASSTFPIVVDCDVDAYDSTFELTVPGGATEVSSVPLPIPVGVTCTVAEAPVPDGWGLDSIAPDSGVVTIVEGTSEVTVTNTRASGSLVVTKQASGFLGGASSVFTVAVACDNGFSQVLTLDVGADGAASELVGPIPSGVTCTVTEPTPPDGWTLADIAPDSVVIGTGPTSPVTVTVTNERTLGHVEIEKVLDGPAAGAATSFTVDLDCDGDQFDRQVALTVPDGASTVTETVPGLPTLIECSVREDVVPEEWLLQSIVPASFTVDDDPAVDVTVTNTRGVGEITVVKRLSGPVAGADTAFTLALDCDQDQFDQEIEVEVVDGESISETISGIPTGTTCSLTEPGTSDGWELASISPSQVVVGDEPVSLVAVNSRLTGGLEIFKYLLGPVDGAPTTFSAFLNCDGTAFDQDVVIEVADGVSSRTVISGIPTGVTCAAEEIQVPEEWSLGGVAGDTITITGTELIAIQVVNTRVTGELTVTKAVEGDPPDAAASFDLVLDCDDDDGLFDTAVPVDLPAGETAVSELFSGIPTGVTCSVSEVALPDGWELVSITPEQIEVMEGEPAVVTVLNSFLPEAVLPDTDTGVLSNTGSDPLPLLVLAALAIAAGFSIVVASRRTGGV